MTLVMTAPRQVLQGTTYLLTRRCARRQLLIRPSAIVNQIFLYCIAFAAEKAGIVVYAAIVNKADQWPGVITLPGDFKTGPIEVQRPDVFFRPEGPMPEKVNLQLHRPPGFDDMTDDEFSEMVNDELELREADIRLQHRIAGRTVLGRKAVLAQDPFDYPLGMEPRRNLNPKIAAKSKWHRIELIRRRADWLEAYAEALDSFLAGLRNILFPTGTYWMVRYASVSCVPPD